MIAVIKVKLKFLRIKKMSSVFDYMSEVKEIETSSSVAL